MPVDIQARVIANTRLTPDYNVIALAAPEIAAASQPGQFVMIKANRVSDPLLRRPFSVFEILREPRGIEGLTLLIKRIGVTTNLLHDAGLAVVLHGLRPLCRPIDLYVHAA